MKVWSWVLGSVSLAALSLSPALAAPAQPVSPGAIGQRTVDVSAISAGGPLRLGAFDVVESERISQVEEKVERLISFVPHDALSTPDRFAVSLKREHGGDLTAYQGFFRARWHDFQGALERYGMRPNDLSTARAFAIVAGFRAYNQDHLHDVTSGSIFRTLLAVQTAQSQWDTPWSNDRKQELYATWGLQGSVLNWYLEGARRSGDAGQLAAVRLQARNLLQQLLHRDPDSVKLDNYACALYPDMDCKTLMRELRAEFALR